MVFEEGHAAETMEIRRCDPPRALHLTGQQGDEAWHLDLDLAYADGVTTLTFTQPDVTPAMAQDVGPGWEYYFDRLVDAEEGRDPAGRDFERDYHPAMSEHYRAQFDAR